MTYTIESLQQENLELNKRLQNVDGLLAQLDAYRQTVSELQNANVSYKTSVILLQQRIQELSKLLSIADNKGEKECH